MNPTASEAVRDDLVERIVNTTRSAQSVPFYRRVIRQLGDGIVEEEFGELRYRMLTGEVRDPAKYFTRLLLNRVCTPRKAGGLAAGTGWRKAQEMGPRTCSGPAQVAPRRNSSGS